MPQIGRVDFCKSKNSARPLETGSPLTTPANELASFGCKPLLAHQRTSDAAILTEMDQKTLGSSTVVASSTETDVPPTAIDASGTDDSEYDPTDLFPSYVAGLGKVQPLTGSATSPFPAPDEPFVDLSIRFGTRRIVRSRPPFILFGNPQPASVFYGDPEQAGDIEAVLGAGYGKPLGSQDQFFFEGDVDLNGSVRRCSRRWRAYHHYRPTLRIPYSPILSPLLLAFVGPGYSLSFNGVFNWGVSGNTIAAPDIEYQGTIGFGLVSPSLVTAMGPTFKGNPALPLNVDGPSLDRSFCEIDTGEFIVGDYASNDTVNLTLDDNLRSNIVIYTDETVVSISATPGSGDPVALDPILLSPSQIFNGQTLTQAFVLSGIDGSEDAFTFTMTGPLASFSTTTGHPLTDTGLTDVPGAHFWWEGYAHIESVHIGP